MTMAAAPGGSASPALTGRDLDARQALVAAVVALGLVAALDLADGHLGFAFSLGFVLIVMTVPLAVDPRGLVLSGFLPPALMLAALLVIAAFFGDALHIEGLPESANVFGRWLASIIDRGVTLLVGSVLAIAAIGVRYWLPPVESA